MISTYNPFKPHVVQFNNGKFGLRKYQMFTGWRYYDQTRNPEFWWYMNEHIPKYCQANSIDELRYPFTAKYFKE
jgi:hypothetical protein